MTVNCPTCKGQIEIPRSSTAPPPPPPIPPPYQPGSKLRPCPDCGHTVSISALSCPNCGRKLKQEQTAVGILAAILIALIIVWIIGGLLYFLFVG